MYSLIVPHNIRRDHKLHAPDFYATRRRMKADVHGAENEVEEWEVTPGNWLEPPHFDDGGRPSDLIYTEYNNSPVSAFSSITLAAPATGFIRNRKAELEAVIADRGVTRPISSQVRKQNRQQAAGYAVNIDQV